MGILVDAGDLAAVVEVDDVCLPSTGDVDRPVDALVQQEPVDRAPRIDVGARDLAAVVEAESLSWEAWNVDRREAAFLEEKAVAAAVRVLVDPQDLPAGVDSQRQRSQGPRKVDGLVSPSLEEKTVDDEADGVVAAHDPPPAVDAVRSRLQDGIRVIDRGELAPVQKKPGAERIHGIVRDAADRRRLRGLSGTGTGCGESDQDEGAREGENPPRTNKCALRRNHAAPPFWARRGVGCLGVRGPAGGWFERKLTYVQAARVPRTSSSRSP